MTADDIKLLAEVDSLSKNNEKRLNNIDKLIVVVQETNKNVAVIAEQILQQGKQIEKLVNGMNVQGDKIVTIEKEMETKETVARLHTRIDEVEKKDGKQAEKQLRQVKWLIISTLTLYFIQQILFKFWG